MAMKIMGLVAYNVAWAEAYLRTKWHLDPSSCLATTDMGWKVGGLLCPFFGAAGSLSNIMWPRLRPTSITSSILTNQPFGHNTRAKKLGKGCCAPLFCGEELGPYLTQCSQDRGSPPRQVSSWPIQPLGHDTPTSQTDRPENSPIAQGELFYKWSPKNWVIKCWHS